jgi:hypothetical protein
MRRRTMYPRHGVSDAATDPSGALMSAPTLLISCVGRVEEGVRP